MTIMNHFHEGVALPAVGDVYAWMGVHLTVRRVGHCQTWADVLVRPRTGESWKKRQPLPLPAAVVPCVDPTNDTCDCARVAEDGFTE